MEEVVLDLIVEACIMAVRKDVINCLMDTECCRWSKRKVKKLAKKLQKRADDVESIEEAKEHVRKSMAQFSPSSSSLESEDIPPILQSYNNNKSVIHDFAKKLSII